MQARQSKTPPFPFGRAVAATDSSNEDPSDTPIIMHYRRPPPLASAADKLASASLQARPVGFIPRLPTHYPSTSRLSRPLTWHRQKKPHFSPFLPRPPFYFSIVPYSQHNPIVTVLGNLYTKTHFKPQRLSNPPSLDAKHNLLLSTLAVLLSRNPGSHHLSLDFPKVPETPGDNYLAGDRLGLP